MAESGREVAAAEGPTVDREALLLLSHRRDPGARNFCRDRLAGAPRSLIVRTDPTSRAIDGDRWPGAVVELADSAPLTPGPPAVDPEPPDGPETVVIGGDLPRLGATVDRYLTTWAAAGHTPHVCVDSLGGLLMRDSIRGGYRFLHVLGRRIERTDGVLHAHARADAHEEEILRTFYPLFDRVVSFSEASAPY